MTAAFDPTELNRLLQLAGPDFAGELLRRLIDDLTTVATRMTADITDCAAVQAQSHVLIALAGTAGALDLYAMADRLHQLALDRDASGMAALLPTVTGATFDLVRTIAGVNLA